MCVCLPLAWTLDLRSGVAAGEAAIGVVATEDIKRPPVILRADAADVLLAAELATLLALGRPAGTTKAPADEALQHSTPMIAPADFILKIFEKGNKPKTKSSKAEPNRTAVC